MTSIDDLGLRARRAAKALAVADSATKAAALHAMADAVEASSEEILEANRSDLDTATEMGISGALLDRLRLDTGRVNAVAAGLRKVAGLPDPVGLITGGWTLPNGIRVERSRVPLGVVAVIYEARPNVTGDAAGLCIRSGNAALLRGSSYALRSNAAIAQALRTGLDKAGLPADAVQLVEDTTRQGAKELMTATEWVDLLVPRGGPGLIEAVSREATVPVVIDGAGNCHIFVDSSADLDAAEAIILNSKTQRPGVCNAAEKLLVHEDLSASFLPRIVAALSDAGVEVRGGPRAREAVPGLPPVGDDEWGEEYLDLVMGVEVVADVDAAIEHIGRHGTGHTEAILSRDSTAIDRFTSHIDAAVTMVNTSTRFTDGEMFGFGAEIGISTQKLHVRGPMGLEALTCERYVLRGSGQVR